MTLTAEALGATANQRARELHARARFHKRQSSQHRRAAQLAMRELEALRRDCERLGIRLVIEPRPQPKEA